MYGAILGKIGATVLWVGAALIAGAALRAIAHRLLDGSRRARASFWTGQTIHLLTLAAVVLGVIFVWRDAARQMSSVAAWIAAGLTVALQRVITAFAGYLIILRGSIFTIGDRITIGGVRGDVVRLGFMQTTVMEMGQPPVANSDAPAMWVLGRQYTGRIVRVTNDKIFDTPIYNYTRQFPFIWDEIAIPIRYADDRARVERILLDVAERHTRAIAEHAAAGATSLVEDYHLPDRPELAPRVYFRLTDNWLELSVRFLARDHDVRALKDAMSRDILAALDEARIGIASGTYAIVELPPVTVRTVGAAPAAGPAQQA